MNANGNAGLSRSGGKDLFRPALAVVPSGRVNRGLRTALCSMKTSTVVMSLGRTAPAPAEVEATCSPSRYSGLASEGPACCAEPSTLILGLPEMAHPSFSYRYSGTFRSNRRATVVQLDTGMLTSSTLQLLSKKLRPSPLITKCHEAFGMRRHPAVTKN